MTEKDTLLLGFSKGFLERAEKSISFDTSPTRKHYDLIALNEKGSLPESEISGELLLCPHSVESAGKIKCRTAVTCGMNGKSTLSFSSVRYEDALLSVSRRIDGKNFTVFQGDIRAGYDGDLTLYENLVLNGIKTVNECRSAVDKQSDM